MKKLIFTYLALVLILSSVLSSPLSIVASEVTDSNDDNGLEMTTLEETDEESEDIEPEEPASEEEVENTPETTKETEKVVEEEPSTDSEKTKSKKEAAEPAVEAVEEIEEEVVEKEEIVEEKRGFTLEIKEALTTDDKKITEDNALETEETFILELEGNLDADHNYEAEDKVTFNLPESVVVEKAVDDVTAVGNNNVANYIINNNGVVEVEFLNSAEAVKNGDMTLSVEVAFNANYIAEDAEAGVINPIGTENAIVVPFVVEEEEDTAGPFAAVQENLITSFDFVINPGPNEIVVESGEDLEVDLNDMNAVRLIYGITRPDEVMIADGDTYTIDLPSIFNQSVQNRPITVDGVEVATYSIINNQLIITFNNSINDYDDVEMDVNLSGNFNKEVFETEEDETEDVHEQEYKDSNQTSDSELFQEEVEGKKDIRDQLDGDSDKVKLLQENKSNTVTVKTVFAFKEALENPEIEIVNLAANVNIGLIDENSTDEDILVDSKSGIKVINAQDSRDPTQFYSIDAVDSSQILLTESIAEFTVRFANLRAFSPNGLISEVDGASPNVNFENIKFYNITSMTTIGTLAKITNGEVHFYGDNIVNTGGDTHALIAKKVVVHENTNVNITNRGSGAGLHFINNKEEINSSGLEVYENANVEIISAATVITSDSRINILIRDAESVDFLSTMNNGKVFNDGIVINFEVEKVSLHGWNDIVYTAKPKISPRIVNGKFTFDNNTIVHSMSPIIPNFEKNFLPGMVRMMFHDTEEHPLDLIVHPIFENSKSITGMTKPGTTVTVYDENDTEIGLVQSGSDGSFTFELQSPPQEGESFKFIATALSENISEMIEVIVQSNSLELVSVPEIISFGETEIINDEVVIYSETEDLSIYVKDTRTMGSWTLSVKTSKPLKHYKNKSILEDVFFLSKNGKDIPFGNESAQVASRDQTSNLDIQEVSFAENEGIYLKLNPTIAEVGLYEGEIEWSLTNGL